MKNTVGSYQAKTHLPRLLERAARGERITITRHGVPIAMLVPFEKSSQMTPREAVEAMREFRRTHKLGKVSIRELIEEGRRY